MGFLAALWVSSTFLSIAHGGEAYISPSLPWLPAPPWAAGGFSYVHRRYTMSESFRKMPYGGLILIECLHWWVDGHGSVVLNGEGIPVHGRRR
jgi:hypothetical protein